MGEAGGRTSIETLNLKIIWTIRGRRSYGTSEAESSVGILKPYMLWNILSRRLRGKHAAGYSLPWKI